MRTVLVILAVSTLAIAAALAQPSPPSATAKADLLSMDQKIKIGEIITQKTPALTGTQFSPVVDQAVPSQIPIQALPPEAEQIAPELRGYGCIVFEELVAIVDQNTRKVAAVIPRWRQQDRRG